MAVWLVAGLGNPGARFVLTRHNAGFMLVDAMADAAGIRVDKARYLGLHGEGRIGADTVVFFKPQTYMNHSGEAVLELVRAYGPDARLLVLFDDLDLPPGRLRLRRRGGHGGHRGMESIIQHLGHGDFPRMKFGIGRPPGTSVVDYVLSPFDEEEWPLIRQAIERSLEALRVILADGIEAAMNRFNADPGPKPLPPPEGEGRLP